MNVLALKMTCAGTLALVSLNCVAAQMSAPRAITASVAGLTSETPSGGSSMPVVSADGRYVAFISRSLNLITNPTSGSYQVFLRDLANSNIVLVSATAVNTGGNDHSILPSLSSNGLWIAFESEASDLVSGDTNGVSDIFVRDVAGGQTIVVGRGNAASRNPIISADGRYVAFESRASNLVTGDTNRAKDVFLADVASGTSILVSVNLAGESSASGSSELLEMTPDGRFIVFWSDARDISADRTNRTEDFYVRDVQTAVTYCISKSIATNGVNRSLKTALSADGRYAALQQPPSVPNARVFLADVLAETVMPIHWGSANGAGLAINADGTQIVYIGPRGLHLWESSTGTNRQVIADPGVIFPPPPSFVPTIESFQVSRDFERIVFTSAATNYANTPPRGLQLYAHEIAAGRTTLLSSNTSGQPINRSVSANFSIDHLGTLAAFETAADDLSAGDRNRAPDVFVHGLGLIVPRHPELPERTGSGFARLQRGNISANGERIAFASTDSSLAPRDTNSHYDVFVADFASNQLINVDGVLRSNSASATAISADGGWLVLERFMGNSESMGVRELYRADLRGAQIERIGVAGFTGTATPWDASWSQDGRWLVFKSGSHILVRDFQAPAAPGMPVGGELVDLRFDGTRVGNWDSWTPRISLDGEWVVFTSRATDLTEHTGFPPNVTQVFARNLRQRRTRLLSITASGNPLPAGATNPVLSANARFVVFQTVFGSTIYRHDLFATGQVTNDWVCTNCSQPSISADGRLVAFQSQGQIWVADFQKPFTQSIGGERASEPTISLDGRFVVYTSRAGGVSQIYLHDRWKRTTHLLSRNYLGTAGGNGPSDRPALSHDGWTVAFQSFASDLVPGDYNERRDIFVVQIAPLDTDGDGLDDDWEEFYFGGLAQDGGGNLDGDHQTDRDEFLAGTNPRDPTSALRLTGIASRTVPGPLQDTELKWTSAPGKTYRIQHKPDLATGWSDLPGEIITGGPNGSATHLASPIPGSFYRIVLDTP